MQVIEALCDADQGLTPVEFATLMRRLGAIARAIGHDI
jgi:3-deoxy-D-arabino-heptulosonate 7-phosphate (DAHP) synthase